MNFKVEEKVRGKADTDLEFCEAIVVEDDGKGNIFVTITDCEYDEDRIGENTTVSSDDLELLSTAQNASSVEYKARPVETPSEMETALLLGII